MSLLAYKERILKVSSEYWGLHEIDTAHTVDISFVQVRLNQNPIMSHKYRLAKNQRMSMTMVAIIYLQ